MNTAELLLLKIEQLDQADEVPDYIYITAPDRQMGESDKDSGNEDCDDPNRLNAKQMLAEAETNLSQKDIDGTDKDEDKEKTSKFAN